MTDTGRCPWCGTDPLYVHYHDTVWGRPEYDELALFEKLCLDGQQAGLSWITILRKQGSYREAYDGFDPERIARYDDAKVAELLANPGIIRNRLKVRSIIKNARGFLEFREKGESFSDFLWSFVDGAPIQNAWEHFDEVPVTTPESEAMSRALKRAGFTFVGPTIVYAFMQATGMVNDHLVRCPQHQRCLALGN
ncbi:DNA-3-methyladenine glycosylase I [Marinobacter sp. M216]|uniref:DNA-3-methyladenine glycosylase I n=1 Tax=Marinobacter albus TaxID=3030833 RepID=A0ABT7HDM7_9GAMM|nr:MULTISPECIES: DNA-3-methyladenine glycosylase I [unclassified Marinobacter]MBW7471906.1 DNA-3-methyladenine glycosylase I [Marinobacter sp. F4218]MDK9558476.1 DNA-3-methyladenine glycosylase I [Marinobacter sp. M216]